MNRLLIDFSGILLIYGIYGVAAFWVFGQDDLLTLGQYALVVIGISLCCTLAWYALGAWGIKPFASLGVWMGTWLILLVIIVAAAVTVSFLDKENPEPWLNFAGGLGAFYLASALFSPPAAKFLIWPSKSIRTW